MPFPAWKGDPAGPGSEPSQAGMPSSKATLLFSRAKIPPVGGPWRREGCGGFLAAGRIAFGEGCLGTLASYPALSETLSVESGHEQGRAWGCGLGESGLLQTVGATGTMPS